MADPTVEMAWFAALCDDDYELLGRPDPALASSWTHCRNIVLAAEEGGFDNVLLPSGYALGIDSTAFAAAVAPLTSTIRLLLAVRVGELVVPQLARQLATVDQISGGRLTVNVISSDVPGERPLPSDARYRRTLETMAVLRDLMDGRGVSFRGEFVRAEVDPPRIRTVSGRCPPFYFGGLSDDAKACAAAGADVYLMWPDTVPAVRDVVADVSERARQRGRRVRFGWRSHVIVRDSEEEARAAARRLVSALDDTEGARIRSRSLDAASVGVRRQAELREVADDEGYADRHLWTGVGRARSGAGAAIVGDPDQVSARIGELREAGIDAFILSGYPHLAECDLFARHVLPLVAHAPLVVTGDPVALS
ncbi:MAG TPA: LLM class flavin-dependent oxidoreductase [Acidimicrobiales bacterium]|nr:LLM class flavin-dependent oxidoreductase [Acidimicrobiales bacterium]